MRKALAAVGAAVLLSIAGQAGAQDITVGDLRTKGAVVLSADEVKSLLTGATVRYETAQYEIQFKMESGGKLIGSVQKRIGSAGGTSLTGDWKVTDDGRWCGSTSTGGQGGAEWCRSVLKVGNTYYYAAGAAKDPARPAYELKVSK